MDSSTEIALSAQRARVRSTILMALALVVVALLYKPGLAGTFLFDDYPNIVDNQDVHVTTSTARAWTQAMWASPASEFQRPLASLSFALNHFFTGLAPAPMKATNLAIHLLNGWLLFVVLRRIVRIACPADSRAEARTCAWLPAIVATAWVAHPINLGAVLFVVQRMESLAQVFVLLGLWFYLDARQRQSRNESGAGWRLWLAVPACTVLGVAAKESAVLLPLYAAVLELTVLGSLRRPRASLLAFFCVFLIIPGALGLAWLLPGVLGDGVYSFRAFTLAQRLLTEPRVLLDYAAWTLCPLPGFFSFYHDDYPISTGLLTPPATLFSIIGLLAIVVAAVFLRKRRPLAALGLGWFLAAHALTGNILPLELVFEHRNYFASAGLLLAAISLVWPITARPRLPLARIATVAALLLLCAGSLFMRATIWGDPVLFAVNEAARHPQSPRATYDLGRTYVLLSGYRKDSANVPRAIDALEQAARVPRASVLPEVGLIMVASRTERPIEVAWWQSMIDKLKRRPPTPEDDSAIKSLTACQREGRCVLDDENMLRTYLAAISHPRPSPSMLYSYAIFAQNRMHDPELALQAVRDAAATGDVQYQLNLIGFLLDLSRSAEAQDEFQKLLRRVRPGSYADQMAALRQRMSAQAPLPSSTEPDTMHAEPSSE